MRPIANRDAARLVDELDAHLFTGDTFFDEGDALALAEYLVRWGRRLHELRLIMQEEDGE